jgi:cell division protein FtsQ
VVTNFPDVKKLKAKDSALLNDVKKIVTFVDSNSFWSAQIAQIDIVASRNFEMIPTIGHHIIRIGNAENLDQKFHRLFIFYKKVLSKTGFDKYSALDVQYKEQVVAVQKGAISVVDSLQLKKNVEELMERSRMQQYDTAEQVTANNIIHQPTLINRKQTFDTSSVKHIAVRPVVKNNLNPANKKIKPNPVLIKLSKKSGTVVKPVVKRKTDVKKPKAVMHKKH